MNTLLIILLLIVVISIVYLIYELKKPKLESKDNSITLLFDQIERIRKEVQESGGKNREELMQRLDTMNKSISNFQGQTNKGLRDQFKETRDIITEVTKKLTQLEGTNKQVLGFAEQMKSLENILRNPKQRGILGEAFLENLLANVLPPANYKMQYQFENGETVDAVVFANDKIIPIDAKYSLENYNRMMEAEDDAERIQLERSFKTDLQKRIDETSKYIRPMEGTTDFVLMFVPADGIFYNLLAPKKGTLEINAQDFVNYANAKRVSIVSPMTLYAYLQTILHALKSLKIEESAKDIQKRVAYLGRHLNAYHDYMDKLGGHLTKTVGSYNSASSEFKKIDKDVLRITEGEANLDYEPLQLDRPQKFGED